MATKEISGKGIKDFFTWENKYLIGVRLISLYFVFLFIIYFVFSYIYALPQESALNQFIIKVFGQELAYLSVDGLWIDHFLYLVFAYFLWRLNNIMRIIVGVLSILDLLGQFIFLGPDFYLVVVILDGLIAYYLLFNKRVVKLFKK